MTLMSAPCPKRLNSHLLYNFEEVHYDKTYKVSNTTLFCFTYWQFDGFKMWKGEIWQLMYLDEVHSYGFSDFVVIWLVKIGAYIYTFPQNKLIARIKSLYYLLAFGKKKKSFYIMCFFIAQTDSIQHLFLNVSRVPNATTRGQTSTEKNIRWVSLKIDLFHMVLMADLERK